MLSCGLDLPHVAVLATLFSFALIYLIDTRVTYRIDIQALASEHMVCAGGLGITNEQCWYDPVVVPVSSQQNQVVSIMAFMEMLPMMAEGCKSYT